MGGNSTAEALSATNRSTTMATGVPIPLTSAHSQSSVTCMYLKYKCMILFLPYQKLFKFKR